MRFPLRAIAWTAFGLAVVLLLGCSIYLVRATRTFSSGEERVAHTREVQTVLEDLGGEVYQASNAAEAYILTGDSTLLTSYTTGLATVPGELDHLKSLTADNADRAPELNALGSDIQTEFSLLGSFIDAHRKGISTIEADARMARSVADLQKRVEKTIQAIRDKEDQLLRSRVAISQANYRHTLGMIAITFGVALVLLVVQMFLLNYSYNQYRRTEEAAKESREIVNAFFSSSTVGFGILDSNLRYTRVNDVLPRMASLKAEDLLGKSVPEIFGARGARTEAVLRDVLKTGTPLLDREVSAELPSSPGQVRYWLLNYFPIPARSGKFNQLGIIAVDVTARRNAESALRRLSGRLLGIQDQERRRIARELHDSLGQYLAGLKIALEMLSASPAPEKQKTLLTECNEIIDKSIIETRTLSHLLHPPLLDEAGFASAASWFVNGFSQRSGIPVSLELPEDLPRLSEAVEIALFRVLQESLTNVHRHSQARSAEIKLELDAEQITLDVADHGRGMPQHVLQQLRGDGTKLGVGLAGMRERIRELGGNFEVVSDEGGTRVRATVPFAVQDEQLGGRNDLASGSAARS